MSSLLGKIGRKSQIQDEEASDEAQIASSEITALKQQVKALTESTGSTAKRLQEFSALLSPYMKETRAELDSTKKAIENLAKALEDLRKGAPSIGAVSEEGQVEGGEGDQPLPKSSIGSLMRAADTLINTAHELKNTTATYFPKIDKHHQNLTDQLILVHQKLSTVDGRLTTMEKMLKIKTPSLPSNDAQAVGARGLEGVDPEIASILQAAQSETEAELAAQRKQKLQEKLRSKLDTVGLREA